MTEKPGTGLRSIIFDSDREPMKPDWIVIFLPTVLAVFPIHAKGGLLLTGLAVATAYLRKPEGAFQSRPGPIVALISAATLSFGRPENLYTLLIFLMISLLVFRLIATVDARSIISSLIDGCGLYLVINVVTYAVGFRSSAYNVRIGGLVESSGFERILFPLAGSINIPPAVAAVFVVGFPFVFSEKGALRRALRSLALLAAAFVMVSAGSRSSIIVSAAILVIVFSTPGATRWLAQAATALAATFAFLFPLLSNGLQFAVAPMKALSPGRSTSAETVLSLQGRDRIWASSIKYWQEWVNDLPSKALGFGASGQYRSGASGSYSTLLEGTVRNPERSYVHNSFLQQLFDGGVIGFAVLAVAAFWAGERLAKRRTDWGTYAIAGTVGLTVVVLVGITEVTVAPGPAQLTFWVFMIFVGASCQAGEKPRTGSRLAIRQPLAVSRHQL